MFYASSSFDQPVLGYDGITETVRITTFASAALPGVSTCPNASPTIDLQCSDGTRSWEHTLTQPAGDNDARRRGIRQLQAALQAITLDLDKHV